jgi:hypothetical protein
VVLSALFAASRCILFLASFPAMHATLPRRALLLSTALHIANAVVVPDPTAIPAQVEASAPKVTPAPIMFEGAHSYMMDKRNVISDVVSGADSVAKSWGSVLGTDLPSYFTQGIPNWFQGALCETAGLAETDNTQTSRVARRSCPASG